MAGGPLTGAADGGKPGKLRAGGRSKRDLVLGGKALAMMRPDQANNKTLADQWALHRSQWRLVHSLVPYIGPPAHTLRRIWPAMLVILGITVTIKALGAFLHIDFDSTNTSKEAFRLSSFVVALLLSFRVQRVFDRWWQARNGFAGVGNGVTAIVRQAAVWCGHDPVLVQMFQRWALAWHYAVLQLVTGKTQVTDPRVIALMDSDELELYSGTNKPRLLAGAMISVLASQAGLTEHRLQLMEHMVEQVTKDYGVAVRIKLQAMPYALTLFSTGFVTIWLLLLPFGFMPEADWGAGLVCVGVTAVMMLGLDDLCNRLEDPFEWLPLEKIVQTTERDVGRIVGEIAQLQALAARKRVEGYPALGLPGSGAAPAPPAGKDAGADALTQSGAGLLPTPGAVPVLVAAASQVS